MGYTKFGEYFRILRIKNNEVLVDAKKFLGTSTAFISAVECGKKKIPDGWFIKIVNHYNLTDEEQNELINAIDESQDTIKINLTNASQVQKQLILQFQRSFEDLSEDDMNEIQKILERRRHK